MKLELKTPILYEQLADVLLNLGVSFALISMYISRGWVTSMNTSYKCTLKEGCNSIFALYPVKNPYMINLWIYTINNIIPKPFLTQLILTPDFITDKACACQMRSAVRTQRTTHCAARGRMRRTWPRNNLWNKDIKAIANLACMSSLIVSATRNRLPGSGFNNITYS